MKKKCKNTDRATPANYKNYHTLITVRPGCSVRTSQDRGGPVGSPHDSDEKGRLVQLGPPEEIYSSPATAFVARFTGLAGELPVRVRAVRHRAGTIEVEPTGELALARPLHVRSGMQADGVRDGLLTIRPTAVRICAPGADEHHVLGTVTDVAFGARGYEHAVHLPGETMISGVLASARMDRGETVGLHFEPAGCMVFPHHTQAVLAADANGGLATRETTR